jgi:cation transporter-like permease
MFATVVETKELLETVAYSLIAGVGVAIVFSLAIYGATRFADLSRNERPAAAAVAAVIAGLALAATIGAVVVGIIAMTQK